MLHIVQNMKRVKNKKDSFGENCKTFLKKDPMNTHGDATVLAACLSKPGRIKLWHLFQVTALLGTVSIFEEVRKVVKILFQHSTDFTDNTGQTSVEKKKWRPYW